MHVVEKDMHLASDNASIIEYHNIMTMLLHTPSITDYASRYAVVFLSKRARL